MRHFTYQGDREETQLFGLRFLRGEPTGIPEDFDPKFLQKLENNREFAEAFGDYTVSGNTVDVQATEVSSSSDNQADDEQQESDELEQLRQEADSLGVKVDMRWKAPRLKREIEAARG